MKRFFSALLLVVALACSNTAAAFGFDWGVTGGLNYTKLNLKGEWKNMAKSENRAGWFIGPKVNVGLIAGFGVDGALLYSQRKFNLTDKEDGQTVDSKTQRSIEIPINLKYSIGVGSIANVYLATGPQFGFNVGNHTWRLGSDPDNGMFKTENMTTTWNVGAGVKLLGHLDVGISYNFALTKMGKTLLEQAGAGDYIGKSDDYKANTFQVQATYYF